MSSSDLTDDAWFAGFAAGEGCFGIRKEGPIFTLGLRLDDLPIIEALRDTFGGSIHITPMRAPAAPRAMWYVAAKRDLADLVRYFDAWPLRARKAQDYVLWRRAVIGYCRSGKNHPELPALRQALMASRAYEAAEFEVTEPAVEVP